MKIKIILIFLLINLHVISPCNSAELSFESVLKNYQQYITNIYTCGEWDYENKKGFYRIIYIEYLNGCSWLYIQWMKDLGSGPALGTTQAFFTLPIYTNDHHENTFNKPVALCTTDGIKLIYLAENGHNDKTYEVEIEIFNEFGKFAYNEKEK